ncbi:conserved Plasmodium protein, unknown function [Babesia microti strain RI]|uniref:Uncharacterized protein n=1 Tax=Babesia microti (strain RI) TaxID=1133968 RepID=A0A0K3AQJ1_BABMR|nr:conserved Plasmodium protein, unknown function [Babesia microti strain RI]CTQ40720.1 conserved Plasmodium protein, unknown function [Babesia microti strain RI]|eukprot:XP_012648731.1 conserved Plasmodium protein, unknown function [Babesia microti strain RI]
MFMSGSLFRNVHFLSLRHSILDKWSPHSALTALRNFSTGNNGFDCWKDYSTGKSSIVFDNRRNYQYNPHDHLTIGNTSYGTQLTRDAKFRYSLGLSPFFTLYSNPLDMVKFTAKYLLSFRFLFIYMARTTFQAVRPLLAFCVFGEIMKLILATMNGGIFAFLFSFVLAFEVLYFFLQCFISYTFLTMFYTLMF